MGGRSSTGVRLHEATALTRADVEALRETVRCRVLGWFHRRRLRYARDRQSFVEVNAKLDRLHHGAL